MTYPSIEELTSYCPIDFETLRHELVTDVEFIPSFGKEEDLQLQIDMLEKEFAGQQRLKFVHAVLNVLLRRRISTKIVYAHFRALWTEHADIMLDTLDSRWLVSACDTISDHSTDQGEAQCAILVSLFVNTLKLGESEQLINNSSEIDPEQIKDRTPLFDGLTAFMPGVGDMPANMLQRLERSLQPNSLPGMIAREVISRALSAETVFARFSKHQKTNRWRPFLAPVSAVSHSASTEASSAYAADISRPGYILLNETSRLAEGSHLGTIYSCESIRQNLAHRGLKELGWANDRKKFEELLCSARPQPALVVLNGEGTLHHGAPRAVELLSLCAQASEQGIKVAVINSVWEANPDAMTGDLRNVDLVHVRDSLSKKALPDAIRAEVTPDVSIKLFRQIARSGQFFSKKCEIGVIDSVLPAVSDALLSFAETKNMPFFAMSFRNLRDMRTKVTARSGSVWPRLLQITDIMGAHAWVTGRFHGLIAGLSAGVPVCAVSSNTSKIEGMLIDAGLAHACLLDQEWLSAPNWKKHEEVELRFEMQKTPEFINCREKFFDEAVQRIDIMLDKSAALARTKLLPK